MLASLGKNARIMVRNRSVDRIKFFLGEAQHLPPFKLVMVTFSEEIKVQLVLQFGVSRGRREVLLALRRRVYLSEIVSEFGPLR